MQGPVVWITVANTLSRRPDVALARERSVGFELKRILDNVLATLRPGN